MILPAGLLLLFLFATMISFGQAPAKQEASKKAPCGQTIGCTQQNCKSACDPANKGKNKDCPNFVDKDKNGVCDRYTEGKGCCGNGKGQGLCNGTGKGNGHGACCGKTNSPTTPKPESK